MATIIKLTYTITGKTTLINADKITTAFRIFEKSTRKYATRINFDTDSYIIVDEEMQDIKQIIECAISGEYQSNDWVDIDSGVGEDFHEKLENNYNDAYQPRQQYAPRKRNYGYQQQNNQRW
jgi:hypothetical protein